MLFCTIAVCYLPAYKLLAYSDFLNFIKTAFYASIGLSNFLFATILNGYFDSGTDYIPLIHTWTLGVEEQFYVIIPLIFIGLWRFGRNAVLFVIGILSIGSFALTFVNLNSPYKFYMLYTRFWELAMGSLIVLLPKQQRSDVFSFTGFSFICMAIFGYSK
jgi:peptidoglycan/LPS O-acetylase OafA/YrhL